jgi:hypothetical protein
MIHRAFIAGILALLLSAAAPAARPGGSDKDPLANVSADQAAAAMRLPPGFLGESVRCRAGRPAADRHDVR